MTSYMTSYIHVQVHASRIFQRAANLLSARPCAERVHRGKWPMHGPRSETLPGVKAPENDS